MGWHFNFQHVDFSLLGERKKKKIVDWDSIDEKEMAALVNVRASHVRPRQ